MPEYQIKFDEKFLIESLKRYRRQHGGRRLLFAMKLVAGALLLALAAFCAARINLGVAVFFVVLLLLMFAGHLIDYCLIKRRLRKSPYWNDNMVGRLTDEGLQVVGSHSDSQMDWCVFTKARVFRDGVLLFQGPGVFNWLPDAALSDGTRENVESLVSAHVEDCKIVG